MRISPLSLSLIAGSLLTAGAFAQVNMFPKPSYFRETFNKTQPKVELKPANTRSPASMRAS